MLETLTTCPLACNEFCGGSPALLSRRLIRTFSRVFTIGLTTESQQKVQILWLSHSQCGSERSWIIFTKCVCVCVYLYRYHHSVILRLDYCNSLLAGLPARAIRPLQLIQKAIAWLVFNLPKFTHTTPFLSLVTSGCPHPLQDTSTCVPCCEWVGPSLHPGHD